MDQFANSHACGHPLTAAEYIAVHLLDPTGVRPDLARQIIQARRLKVATEIAAGVYSGLPSLAMSVPDRPGIASIESAAMRKADVLIGIISSAEADIRQRAFRQAAELIRANGIIFGEDGPRLQPRPEGDRSGLTYADELERLAALEIKE